MTQLDTFLTEKAAKTEAAMRRYMNWWAEGPSVLREAAEYSLFAGGKRIRPALALGAADIVAGIDEPAIPAACAIEMIHTYSLIHDDLPAMDDDDLRRGKPTLHKAYGEALAILAGDALLTAAFDILAQTGNVRVLREIASAAGPEGMAGGQVMDLQSEGKEIGLDTLRQIHARKTGALIAVSVRSGAILAGATDKNLHALTQYGRDIGLAFQIADDILDVTGEEAAMGKRAGSDAAKQKSTYPGLLGLDESRRLAWEAADRAVAALQDFGPEADLFRAFAKFTVERKK